MQIVWNDQLQIILEQLRSTIHRIVYFFCSILASRVTCFENPKIHAEWKKLKRLYRKNHHKIRNNKFVYPLIPPFDISTNWN